ncbi:hypothetical protein ACFV29_45045 [Streptomyces sp. NPDC059690]|uniref:hypothetical protein n=1 Tax=Streptomyces sp. NPDC059690 TaxID=3346907 RepID=UPI0036A2AD3D
MTIERPRIALLTCALALAPALLLTACDAGGGAGAAHGRSESAPGRSKSSGVQQEKRLAAAARAGLAAASADAPLVSGLDRVSDGFQDELGLPRGSGYRVTVACAGRGTVQVGFVPARTAPAQRVACDGVPVSARFAVQAAGTRIDVRGGQGATGMIAWRVDKVRQSS